MLPNNIEEDFNLKSYYVSLKWNKGSRDFVQGVKGNKVPYNAAYGGNGSFVCETPAELIITVITADGRKLSKNIINVVKSVNGWSRLTRKRVDLLEAKLMQVGELQLNERDYFVNLADNILI